ncbi:hypothetical protein BURPS668_2585 [Burkholderia pseudomallei 668]|nr:hypothetical protein BURPS668_2585 [Burkholderia pseudomallei 668]
MPKPPAGDRPAPRSGDGRRGRIGRFKRIGRVGWFKSGGSSAPAPPNDRTASADAATASATPIGHERCGGSRIDRAGRLVADRRA